MCGIAGILSLNGQPISKKLISSMAAIMAHRGPDDEGYLFVDARTGTWQIAGGKDTPEAIYGARLSYTPELSLDELAYEPANLCLGTRRLAIVDLSPAGHQPMSYADGGLWITYNGEIYNYVALCTELESQGHLFRSRSDTEVILAAYAAYGVDCLQRLKGMFAFLLYDRTERRLLAARDRFGIKPLYYWVSPEGFVAFASEIKQFSALPGWGPRVNGQRCYDFLAWGLLDHTDETLFHGVFQVPPGEAIALDLGRLPALRPGERLPTFRWYTLRPRAWTGDYRTAAGQLRELFFNSVDSHLQADVPVGSCLSGGVDSSSVVCAIAEIMQRAGNGELQHVFSARADDPSVDEGHYMDIVLEATGVCGHSVTPRLETLFDTLDAMTWYQDEPFGSTSIYAQWRVFELAASHGVKVMLDGQGGDEQLAGYHSFLGPHLARLLREGRLGALLSEILAARAKHGYSPLQSLKWMADCVLPEAVRQPLRRLAGKATADPPWLDMDRLSARPADPFFPKPRSVFEMSHGQLTHLSLQMLLHWEDRDSMAHSIEARVPFLDHQFVEFVLGLPDEFKLWRGVTKRIFREAMQGILPGAICDRMDKLGFATPEEVWMLKRQPNVFRDRLALAIEQSRGILRPNALAVFDRMVAGASPFSFLPWRMISFGAWMQCFGVGVGHSTSLPGSRK